MSVLISDPDFVLHVGDVREELASMQDGSVDCVVTSPPYWGLRDYGTGVWDGGDKDCDHLGKAFRTKAKLNENWGAGYSDVKNAEDTEPMGQTCSKCGARRQDQQVGLEPTPDQYITNMVAVFREVRRVLADHGTCWVNIGDSYATRWGSVRDEGRAGLGDTVRRRRGNYSEKGDHGCSNTDLAGGSGHAGRTGQSQAAGRGGGGLQGGTRDDPTAGTFTGCVPTVLKEKDLVGIPWRLAFALQQPYYTGRIKDERDRIWLAAMVDAEGCIYVHKRKAGASNGQGYERKNDSYGSGMEISNTSREVVERIAAITGRGSISTVEKNAEDRRRQTLYRWNLRTNECRDVLREVYPHLVAKQHQARIAIGCPSSGADAVKAHESLMALHRGGEATIDFPAPETLFEPGWYLRSDIVWGKPNPMPESVTDRPTKSHEYVFLLSKRPRYWFDQEAVREPNNWPVARWGSNGKYEGEPGKAKALEGAKVNPAGRNVRSVWEIPTQPYAEAHFATYPEELVRRCLLAGCPERVCVSCGRPSERITGRDCVKCGVLIPTQAKECGECGYRNTEWREQRDTNEQKRAGESNTVGALVARKRDLTSNARAEGWSDCGHNTWRVGTVLDPFLGSGTTALVARKHGRRCVGIELNPEYAELAVRRNAQQTIWTTA